MDVKALIAELTYKAVRSSGSGGQHVNKVSSKVVLFFNIETSKVFNDQQKQQLCQYFKNRLNKEGVVVLSAGESRSQFRNKALVTQRLLELIADGLKTVKPRKATTVPKAIKQKRLDNKRKQSDKKANRKPPRI